MVCVTCPARGPYSKSLHLLGAIQLVCGITASLIGIMCTFEICWAHFLYLNCWTGALYIVVGMLTIVSARLRNSQLALTNVLFTSLTVLLTLMSGAMNSVGILNELEVKWYLMPSMHLLTHDNYWTYRLTGSNKRFSLQVTALVCDILQCVISLPQAYLEFQRYMRFHKSNGHQHAHYIINKNYGVDTTDCAETFPIIPLQSKQRNINENYPQMAMHDSVVFCNPIHVPDAHCLSNITMDGNNLCERMVLSSYDHNQKLNFTQQQIENLSQANIL